MILTGQHVATRIKGRLTIELADGEEGYVDVDLDVSSPQTEIGTDTVWEHGDGISCHPLRSIPMGTRFSIFLPSSIYHDGPAFRLTLPLPKEPSA